MCGIVGYLGPKPACGILINGLRRLEYRGYDSAGLALVGDGTLSVCRAVGPVNNLAAAVAERLPSETVAAATMGIAHTRWATHGRPAEENAHPHRDQSGRIAVVHNGVIENHHAIRAQLEERGHKFTSQTDTEALAHLIGACYEGDLQAAVEEALQHVMGTFGICVVSADHPGLMIAARRGSPIVIGMGKNETFVASDVSALVSHTHDVIYLEDNDVARISAGDIEINRLGQGKVSRQVTAIDWNIDDAQRGGYPHFMLKEIHEQPETLANAIRGRLDEEMGTALLSGLAMTPREMASIRRVIVVACGTSMHAGMVGRYAFEQLAGIPVEVEQAAEFRYRNPIVDTDTMVIAVSQSGETADTLAAVREAKQKGAIVAGICNVVGSTIAREVGRGVYLHAGPEIGVASTKAFTSQVMVLLAMALKFGRGRRLSVDAGREFCKALFDAPALAARVLEKDSEIAKLAERIANARNMFYIGRGNLYPTGLEGALKLKEISYIHAEGYHAAELKHGPLALLDGDVPVVAMLNDVAGKDKVLSNVAECRARGAPVIGIATEGDDSVDGQVDMLLKVPAAHPLVTPIPTAVALQLLAYHVARIRGCTIDKPRNLAKSVTVE